MDVAIGRRNGGHQVSGTVLRCCCGQWKSISRAGRIPSDLVSELVPGSFAKITPPRETWELRGVEVAGHIGFPPGTGLMVAASVCPFGFHSQFKYTSRRRIGVVAPADRNDALNDKHQANENRESPERKPNSAVQRVRVADIGNSILITGILDQPIGELLTIRGQGHRHSPTS